MTPDTSINNVSFTTQLLGVVFRVSSILITDFTHKTGFPEKHKPSLVMLPIIFFSC